MKINLRRNKEWEMESHSISHQILCLDKFYKNKNEIKSDSGGICDTPISGVPLTIRQPLNIGCPDIILICLIY